MADDPEAEERVTARSYGLVDASDAASECWLIRLPPALADVWDSLPEGTDLGRLVFFKGGGGGAAAVAASGGNNKNSNSNPAKPSITVHVNESLLQLAQQQRQHQHEQQQEGTGAAAAGSSSKKKKLPSVLPLNYSMQAMTKKVPVLHPFTRNPLNGGCRIMGVVSRTANLQVMQDQSYRALLKDRLVASAVTGTRFVKPVEAADSVLSHNKPQAQPSSLSNKSSSSAPGDNPNLSTSAASKKSFGNAISYIGKRIIEANEQMSAGGGGMIAQGSSSGVTGSAAAGGGPSNKRARQFAPDQPLRSVVFELFQIQPFWSVKDLRQAAAAGGASLANAKRSEADLRDILREIGEYHRSGDHKNLWELKREFQTHGQD
jgi:hypothetical protein